MLKTIKQITQKRNTANNGSQSGAVTHHHDKSILHVSFRYRKTINEIELTTIPIFTFRIIILLIDYFYFCSLFHTAAFSQVNNKERVIPFKVVNSRE